MLIVKYDSEDSGLFIDASNKRINVTSSRDALNGYQKGKCFYCSTDIFVHSQDVHVDHFIPHLMKQHDFTNLDGVWNLVLACPTCNLRKLAQRPHRKYLEKLYQRNEFYIGSNHPLRETLINQTGASPEKRAAFLTSIYDHAGELGLLQNWQTEEVSSKAF